MRVRVSAMLVVLLVTALVALVACTGDEDNPSPTSTAAPITPTATVTLTQTPTTQTPTPTSTPAGAEDARRTGDPALDAIIEAVETRDVATLSGLVQYQEIGCTTVMGLGGPPKCEDGEEAGAVHRAFPHGTCEWGWTQHATTVLAQFVERADGAWAALEVTDYQFSLDWPAPDVFLAFHSLGLGNPGSTEDIAIYLEVTAGRITSASAVCSGPLEGLLDSTAWDAEVIAGPWDEALPSPRVTPPATGIAEVDAVIEAVATYDATALRENALEAIQSAATVPCGGDGGPGYVDCDPKNGETPGDEVHVFPMAFCEGAYTRDAREAMLEFLNAAPRLHSVVEPPSEPSGSAVYRHGAYWLVYEFTSEVRAEDGALYGVGSYEGARLQVLEDGGIAVLWYGCAPPLDDLASHAGEPLPVIFDAREAGR